MLEAGLSVLGVLTIFAGLLLVPTEAVQVQIMVVLAGIMALEAGIWGLTQRFLPSDRHFLDLRVESDHFIDLVRDLNKTVIASERGEADADAQFKEVLALMHESVERLGEVAGKVG